MRIRTRLQLLEEIASARGTTGDVAAVEIWIPDNRRGGPPPGRYPCGRTQNVLVIYDPTKPLPPAAEVLP
jgi:hypothetical protein